MTRDHVPPKECENIRDVELQALPRGERSKRSISQGGTHFRTICGYCNNTLLGTEYDPYLAKWANSIAFVARAAYRNIRPIPPMLKEVVKVNRVARSVVGHTLAVCAVQEVAEPIGSAPFPDALRRYFTHSHEPPPSKLEIFYWLYPYREQIFIKGAAKTKFGSGDILLGHVIKFFPIGFWIVWDRPQSVTVELPNLLTPGESRVDANNTVAVDCSRVQDQDFPEAPGKDEAFLLSDEGSAFGKLKS